MKVFQKCGRRKRLVKALKLKYIDLIRNYGKTIQICKHTSLAQILNIEEMKYLLWKIYVHGAGKKWSELTEMLH